MSTTNDMGELPKLHPFCWVCGWRKGGPDSWDGKACKCGYIKKNEIARMACKAFQPRLVGDPCVYPNCACKGPGEVADYVLSLIEAALTEGEQQTAKRGGELLCRAR